MLSPLNRNGPLPRNDNFIVPGRTYPHPLPPTQPLPPPPANSNWSTRCSTLRLFRSLRGTEVVDFWAQVEMDPPFARCKNPWRRSGGSGWRVTPGSARPSPRPRPAARRRARSLPPNLPPAPAPPLSPNALPLPSADQSISTKMPRLSHRPRFSLRFQTLKMLRRFLKAYF